MAVQEKPICISFPAGADLSSNQFRIMGVASDGQIDAETDGGADNPGIVGILQNKPTAAGQGAEVAVFGVSKFEAGAACDEGSYITPVAGGRGSPVAAGGSAYVVGLCVQAASGSGVIGAVLVNPQKVIDA